MSYKVFVIRADGGIDVSEQAKAPELKQLQQAVGGYIETVPYFTKLIHDGVRYLRGVAYADEEGLLKNKPLNRKAAEFWRMSYPHATELCGDVIFYAKVKP